MQSSPLVEVCVEDLKVARAAVAAGADRLEINSCLDVDGLTPDDEFARACVAEFDVPVIAMARPDTANNRFEPAGFIYSESDWLRLLDDARRMLDIGVAGIAAGPLAENGNPDEGRLVQLREICGDRELVFHRAFDVATDWRAAFETIVRCGADRILTSGTAATAVEGTGVLRWMVESGSNVKSEAKAKSGAKVVSGEKVVFGEKAKSEAKVGQGGIEILPACGIDCMNAVLVISETGCDQIHGSFSRLTGDDADPGFSNAEVVKTEVAKLVELFGRS